MDTNSDLAHHALEWLWAVVVGAAGVLGAAVVRLWRHEERIRTLEGYHLQKLSVLERLSDKVDANHLDTATRLDDLAKEIRADLRVIMNRLLTVGHGD